MVPGAVKYSYGVTPVVIDCSAGGKVLEVAEDVHAAPYLLHRLLRSCGRLPNTQWHACAVCKTDVTGDAESEGSVGRHACSMTPYACLSQVRHHCNKGHNHFYLQDWRALAPESVASKHVLS